MKPAASILRLARIGRQRRRLLAEALCEVSLASAAIAVAPFSRVVTFGARQLGKATPVEAAETIALVRWSVEAAALRLPWRALCSLSHSSRFFNVLAFFFITKIAGSFRF